MDCQCRLKQDVPEDAEAQENEELQVTAGAYLVIVARHQAVYGAYGEDHKQIGQRDSLPQRKTAESDGMEMDQLEERLVEQLHLLVEVRMPDSLSCRKNRLPAPINRNE